MPRSRPRTPVDRVRNGAATTTTVVVAVVCLASPPGTLTDRGVGDGSTVAQIESAYGNDHSTMTI